MSNSANRDGASSSGCAAGVNAFVNGVKQVINGGFVPGVAGGANLQPTTTFPADGGIASTGAFSICAVMDAAAAGAFAAAGLDPAAFGGIEYFYAGVPVNIKGNPLPQAPNYKFSAGVRSEERHGGKEGV